MRLSSWGSKSENPVVVVPIELMQMGATSTERQHFSDRAGFVAIVEPLGYPINPTTLTGVVDQQDVRAAMNNSNQSGHSPGTETDMLALKMTAAVLLLRSPRLSVSQILELLDIGDAEFRSMSQDNIQISQLLEARRAGTLKRTEPELLSCSGCGEWFVPYAGARHCSDECRTIAVLNKRLKA